MANSPQARKRILRNDKREAINKARRTRVRGFVKRVEAAIEAGDAGAAREALRLAQPEMMRGVAKGVLHKNTMSRKVSRLSKRIAAIG
ncbi:MAG: 30S ribosomal protein S20 [Pseudomonadota bacterium]